MKHIAFVFTTGDSLVSKAIRLQTWGDVNHAAFEFFEDSLLIQIQNPKVIGIPPGDLILKSKAAFRFVFEAPDELYDEALNFAKVEMIGKAYDKVSVARFLIPLRRILGWLKPAKRAASNTWFCSEGTEVLARKVKLALVRELIDAARISPQQQYSSIRLDSYKYYEEFKNGSLVYTDKG